MLYFPMEKDHPWMLLVIWSCLNTLRHVNLGSPVSLSHGKVTPKSAIPACNLAEDAISVSQVLASPMVSNSILLMVML